MDPFVEMNRDLWDEWTAIHDRSAFYDLESFRAGGVRLADYELRDIGRVEGRSVLAAARAVPVLGAGGAAVVPGRGLLRGPDGRRGHPARALVEPRHGRDHPGAIDAGLQIELFREYPWCDWDLGFCEQHDDGRWYLPRDFAGELPLFYALRAPQVTVGGMAHRTLRPDVPARRRPTHEEARV